MGAGRPHIIRSQPDHKPEMECCPGYFKGICFFSMAMVKANSLIHSEISNAGANFMLNSSLGYVTLQDQQILASWAGSPTLQIEPSAHRRSTFLLYLSTPVHNAQ